MNKSKKLPKTKASNKHSIDFESDPKTSINLNYQKLLVHTKRESNYQPETIRGIIDRIKTL